MGSYQGLGLGRGWLHGQGRVARGTEATAWVTPRRLHDADSDAAALREGALPSDGLGRSVFCTRGVSNPQPSRGPN